MEMLKLKIIRLKLMVYDLEVKLLTVIEVLTYWRIRQLGKKIGRVYAQTMDLYLEAME